MMFDPKFYEDEQQDSPALVPLSEWELKPRYKQEGPWWIVVKVIVVAGIFGLALLFATDFFLR